MLWQLTIQNNTSSPMTFGMLDNSNPQNPITIKFSNAYTVSGAPYVASYNTGTVITPTINGVPYPITLSATTTPAGVVNLLNVLNQGFWTVSSSPAGGNVFTMFYSAGLVVNNFNINIPGGWSAQTSGTSQNIVSVYFLNSTNGWAACTNGVMLYTTNGGATWTAGNTGGQTCNFYSVFFISALVGWATSAPTNLPLLLSTIWNTTDGGVTWNPYVLINGAPATTCYSIFFTDANNGWASNGGSIYTTTNGGGSWTPHAGFGATVVNSIWMISTSVGWCCDSTGGIYKTINGGVLWSAQVSTTASALYSINFTDSSNGWAVGVGGVFHTSNGGALWANQPASIGGNTLNWIDMISSTTGWACGSGGIVIYTTTGGATWTTQVSGTSNVLSSINAINANNLWVGGASGTIIVTASGGSSGSSVSYTPAYSQQNSSFPVPASSSQISVQSGSFSFGSFIQGIRTEPVMITKVLVIAPDIMQLSQPISFLHLEDNGRTSGRPEVPKVDSYAMQSEVKMQGSNKLVFSGLDTIQYNVNPKTTVTVIFEMHTKGSYHEALLKNIHLDMMSLLALMDKSNDLREAGERNPDQTDLKGLREAQSRL